MLKNRETHQMKERKKTHDRAVPSRFPLVTGVRALMFILKNIGSEKCLPVLYLRRGRVFCSRSHRHDELEMFLLFIYFMTWTPEP